MQILYVIAAVYILDAAFIFVDFICTKNLMIQIFKDLKN